MCFNFRATYFCSEHQFHLRCAPNLVPLFRIPLSLQTSSNKNHKSETANKVIQEVAFEIAHKNML